MQAVQHECQLEAQASVRVSDGPSQGSFGAEESFLEGGMVDS